MIAKVIVDISNSQTDKIFDYLIPSNLDVRKGVRVIVPFGPRRIEGFCIDIADDSDVQSLKYVEAVLDDFVCISEEMLELMRYMKDKFYVRYVDSLRLFIPSKLRGGRIKELTRLFISLNPDMSFDDIISKISKNAKSQLALVERLKQGGEYLTALSNEFSSSAIKVLEEKKIIIKSNEEVARVPMSAVRGKCAETQLRDAQKRAVDKIFSSQNNVILLHGVTGSGKTLVYINAIQRAISEG